MKDEGRAGKMKDGAGRACLTHPSSFRLHPSAQGIAPQMAMRGVSVMFLKTREKRFIEIISTKPPIP